MPTISRSRKLNASPDEVWEVIDDPYHLPRWWPKVARVEGVQRYNWTSVFSTSKGKPIRADYRLLTSEPGRMRRWTQETAGTPFAKVLREAVTEVRLEPGSDGTTKVTLELRQEMTGLARLGGMMVRQATRRLLDEALDGLSAACER